MGRPSKTKKVRAASTDAAHEDTTWWVYICPTLNGVLRECIDVCVRLMGGGVADSLDKVKDIDIATGMHQAASAGNGATFFVICQPSEYATYVTIRENFHVPIVTPTWIFRSVLQNTQVLLPTEKFSANPAKVFSSIVLYCVQVEADPRKVIASLVANGGGQAVSAPTTAATHVLCMRNSGDDYTQALEWKSQTKPMHDQIASKLPEVRNGCDSFRDEGCRGSLPDIVVQFILRQCGLLSPHIVSYDWVQECIRRGRRVPETEFDFPDKLPAAPEESITMQELVETCQKQTIYPPTQTDELWKDVSLTSVDTLAGETFLLARHIPSAFQLRMTQALEALGATVLPPSKASDAMIQVPKASYVVCGYQSGDEYASAVKLNKTIVSMQWVAACIAAKAIVSTASSPNTTLARQALYAPSLRHGGIDGMESCVITLSGFSARSNPSRDDIQALIRLTGACHLSVLSRSHTTHLLCVEATGEKYKRSVAWGMANVVKYEWLVECVRQWTKAPESDFSWLTKRAPLSAKSESSSSSSHSSSVGSSMLSVTKSTALVPKFQVDDALDALDEKENTPLKTTKAGKTGNSRRSSTTNNKATTDAKAVTTPVQLRKAIESNTIDQVVKPKKTKASPATKQTKATTTTTATAKTSPAPANAKPTKKRSSSAMSNDATVVSPPASPPAKARRTTKGAQTKDCPKPVFLLTGTHEEMAINESIIMVLGGTVIQSKRMFDSSCTHVICKDLRRTEKVIAGMAAGKWILTPAYLKECLAMGYFVDETPFEWGQTKTNKRTVCDHRIALPAIKHWRLEAAAGRPGPLNGRQFGIYGNTTPPPDMCVRIIQAAGGLVVPPAAFDDETLVLVGEEVKKTDKILREFQSKEIPCIAPGFLVDYITKDHRNRPKWESYVV
ncbi:Aste57867_68 [Aphanomyces stellatus]|uniref:Aste57867_68 protein n=1 Tax=Aphanomyces stellatus TaxID=120398 RepID=A0A485K5T4_9STRA|nr:hypothetical protein As57867_000068 [Aphanomyces stellatus]VFT77294.1 Aste57867_68 [Aphanomyces stellatus]